MQIIPRKDKYTLTYLRCDHRRKIQIWKSCTLRVETGIAFQMQKETRSDVIELKTGGESDMRHWWWWQWKWKGNEAKMRWMVILEMWEWAASTED